MTRIGRVLALLGVSLLVGCADTDDDQLFVSAASSLTEVFAAAEVDFERARPGTEVELNVGGSGTLVNQVLQGAPVGVIAVADEISLTPLGDVIVDSEPIASNRIVVVHRLEALPRIDSLGDVGDGVIVVACDPSVPCGRSTQRVVEAVGVPIEIDSLESSVRAVLRRVVSGEADAGFVYRTDVPDDPAVGVFEPGGSAGESTAVVATLDAGDGARSFLEFVRSGGLDRELLRRGFELV